MHNLTAAALCPGDMYIEAPRSENSIATGAMDRVIVHGETAPCKTGAEKMPSQSYSNLQYKRGTYLQPLKSLSPFLSFLIPFPPPVVFVFVLALLFSPFCSCLVLLSMAPVTRRSRAIATAHASHGTTQAPLEGSTQINGTSGQRRSRHQAVAATNATGNLRGESKHHSVRPI